MSLFGCGEQLLAPLYKEATILAFGDSLTAGKGVSDEFSYPAVLAQLTGLNVINAGVSGEITKDGLSRWPDLLAQHSVDLIVLIEGGNDILRNIDPADTEYHLEQMILMARQYGIDIIMFGIPKKSLFSDSAPFYPTLADKHDLVFDEDLIASMLRSSKYKSDSVHFNKDGYRKLALRVQELLQDNGAL